MRGAKSINKTISDLAQTNQQRAAAAEAECERLRGLLATARDALKDAVHTFESVHHFIPAERMEIALQRSDPDARQVSDAD